MGVTFIFQSVFLQSINLNDVALTHLWPSNLRRLWDKQRMLPTWVLPEDGNYHTSSQGQQGISIMICWFGDTSPWRTCFNSLSQTLEKPGTPVSVFLQPPGFFLQTLGRVLPCQCWSFLDRRNRTEATSSSSSVKRIEKHETEVPFSIVKPPAGCSLFFFGKFSFHDMPESYQLLFTTSSDWLSWFVHFDDSEFPCDDIFGGPGSSKTWDAHP